MIFSYQEIEKHFAAPLPGVEAVAEALISHAFEVEEVVEKGGDFDLDVKILPDRAADAKSPLGVAREISAVMNLPLKEEFKIKTTKDLARAVISFTAENISNLIGVAFSPADVQNLLARVGVLVEREVDLAVNPSQEDVHPVVLEEGRLRAYIPAERLDLNIKEDLADEVARLYGYDKVPAKALPPFEEKPVDHPDFVLANQIRAFLVGRGFVEVYGYTFTSRGVVEIEKPLASDKAWLRTNLEDWLTATLNFNLKHVLFPKDAVNLFEIGSVFEEDKANKSGQTSIKEDKRVGLVSNHNLSPVIDDLKEEFDLTLEIKIEKVEGGEVVELPLSAFKIRAEETDLTPFIATDVNYRPVSVYPRIIRDLALLVPLRTKPELVAELIKKEAGPLLAAGPVLFDEFTKPEAMETSLAFRLVFQSAERTLADAEVNLAMEGVYQAAGAKGWQVR